MRTFFAPFSPVVFLDGLKFLRNRPFSFWEGVDVRGDALSLVVIDRLPFSSPDDPILEARIKRIRKDGGISGPL